MDYAIVTNVVTAGSATIFQAESKGASVVLTGNAAAGTVADLMQAGASIQVQSQNNVSLRIVAKSKLTPLFGLAKLELPLLDRISRGQPVFYPMLARLLIGVTRLRWLVGASHNINLVHRPAPKGGLVLNVRLPRYKDYVDIADLQNLTEKASPFRPGRSHGVEVASPTHFDFGTRIPKGRLEAVVDQLPYVEIDEKSPAESVFSLNLTLHASGGKVNVAPLVELATNISLPESPVDMSFEPHLVELP